MYLAVLGSFLFSVLAAAPAAYTIKTSGYTRDYRHGYQPAAACPPIPDNLSPQQALDSAMSGTICYVDCPAVQSMIPADSTGLFGFSVMPSPDVAVYKGFPFTMYERQPVPCGTYTFPARDFIPGMVLDTLYIAVVTALFGFAMRRLNGSPKKAKKPAGRAKSGKIRS